MGARSIAFKSGVSTSLIQYHGDLRSDCTNIIYHLISRRNYLLVKNGFQNYLQFRWSTQVKGIVMLSVSERTPVKFLIQFKSMLQTFGIQQC